MLEVLQLGDVGAVGDRGVGNSESGSEFANVVGVLAFEPLVDLGGLFVRHLGDRQGRVLVDPVLLPDHRAEVEPLLRGAAPDVHQTVFGTGDSGDGEFSGIPPRPTEHLEERDRVIGETQNLRFEHRQVDELASPCLELTQPRRQRRSTGRGAGEIVADAATDEYRCAIGGSAAQTDDAARPRLQGELGGWAVAPRAVQPERGDGRDEQVWMRLPQRRRRQ